MLYSRGDDPLKAKEEKKVSIAMSFHTHKSLSGQPDVRPALPVPMVYESVPVDPVRWEYRVLNVDTREEALPDAAQLNELGNQGCLLVGVLSTGDGRHVQYYFVRQRNE
jgi:hypothetical protein